MTINWFYLVIIYVLTNSASKIIQKYTIKDEEVDPTAFSAFWHLIVGIVASPFIFMEELIYPRELTIWLIPLFSGLIFSICMILYFHALKNTEVSQIETIATTRAIWVMVLGVLFFAEILSWSKIIGVALIFVGLIIIYWRKTDNYAFGKYHVFVFLYAFLISSAYALDKYALNYFSVSLYNSLLYFLPALFTMIIFPKTLRTMKYLIKPKKNNYLIILSCFLQAISTLSLYTAYKYGELSVVGPLAQTTTVFTIIVGITFFKERWNIQRKIVGIILAMSGIMFLKFLSF